MPPAGKKNCSVILFDLATRQREKAIQSLLKIACYKSLAESKDLTKLILLNSDRTDNRLNDRENGYSNINEVAKEITRYNPELLLEMIEENSERGEANWLEGLLVGLINLQEEYEDVAGIVTYQLLFITDLQTPLPDCDNSLINKVVSSLNKLDAFLYVVGPDVTVPFSIKSHEHVRTWMKTLQVDENNVNLTTLKQIIRQSKNSVVCCYEMGVHLFFSYRYWGGSQPWQVPLAIGSQIEIPAQTLKILDDVVVVKLTSSQSAIKQTMWVDAEDESIEFDQSDVVSGIERHNKWVRIEDNKLFQVQNPRGFNVLCFTDSVNVPEYLMRGNGCYCVLPNSTPERNHALCTLIDCLAKQNKYAIARRVYNNNFIPKIVVLVPKPDHKPKCFLLTSLPFAEDIRMTYRERNVQSAPKVEVDKNIYNFLDSLNVDDGNSQKKLSLNVNMMQSINSMRIVNKTVDKLVDKHMELDEIDIDLFEAPTGVAVDTLKNVWPERAIEVQKTENRANVDSDSDFDW